MRLVTRYGTLGRLVQAEPSKPGLVVVDAALNLVASNTEAIQILVFPTRPDKIRQVDSVVSERIRTRLLDKHAAGGSGFVREFRSGNRTYICRSFPLNVNVKTSAPPAIVLVFERRPSNTIAMSEVSSQFGLTPREQETIQLLLQGLTSKEIAERMKISPNTVKAFLRLVMVKMGVSTRSGIIGKIVGPKAS
jgi:DNA-binding CsgD family transcriptional regulator